MTSPARSPLHFLPQLPGTNRKNPHHSTPSRAGGATPVGDRRTISGNVRPLARTTLSMRASAFLQSTPPARCHSAHTPHPDPPRKLPPGTHPPQLRVAKLHSLWVADGNAPGNHRSDCCSSRQCIESSSIDPAECEDITPDHFLSGQEYRRVCSRKRASQ